MLFTSATFLKSHAFNGVLTPADVIGIFAEY